MSDDWESEIAGLLTELADVQGALLGVLNEKRGLLASGDREALSTLAGREERLVERLQGCHDRRQQLLAHPMVGNAFASAMYAHYASDPSFNCFPSLHAAVATICWYAWHRYARQRKSTVVRVIAIGMLVVGIGVVLSTLFVKQHYIADEIAGILLAWGIGRWVFGITKN